MRPPIIKVRVPQNAKKEEITKAVSAKLTRQTTDLLRKKQEVVISIFAFERARSAGAKKTAKS